MSYWKQFNKLHGDGDFWHNGKVVKKEEMKETVQPKKVKKADPFAKMGEGSEFLCEHCKPSGKCQNSEEKNEKTPEKIKAEKASFMDEFYPGQDDSE